MFPINYKTNLARSLAGALLIAVSGTAGGEAAYPQDPVTAPSPAIQSTPQSTAVAQPTPLPQGEPRTNVIGRGVRSLTEDDDETADGRGFHIGPFLPRADILSSGGGPAPVLHFWTPDIGGTALDLHASAAYSIYKYQYYDAQFGLLPHRGGRLPSIETGTNAIFPLADLEKTAGVAGFNIYASARYRDYPREDFYGVGAGSSRERHADYRLQDGLYEGVARFGTSHVSVMARVGLLRTTVLRGGDSDLPDVEVAFPESATPGLRRSPDFFHYSGGVWFEFRDEPRNPHKGVSLGVSFSRFDDRDGSAYEFNRVALDAREYIPLGSNRHVLALRQVLSADDADTGSVVPFYMRTTLGGGSLLRGYPSFRFRDDRLMLLGSEYRFEAHPRIELALIYEVGKVLPAMSGYGFDDLLNSYGAGIRFKSPKKVHFRLDALRSKEGTRWHVKLGRSF
jgi:hypothetical protein